MLGGSPAVSCYIQPKEDPKQVRPHLPVFNRMTEVRQALLNSREANVRKGIKPWSTLTLILKGNGEQAVEYSFEDMEVVNTLKLRQDWKSKHLAGLEFIPDKR